MPQEPYIAVTGVGFGEGGKKLAKIFERVPGNMKWRPGILVSYKSLRDRHDDINPDYKSRYPRLDSIPGVLRDLGRHTAPTIHYNTRGNFYEELESMLDYWVRLGLKGLQLNVTWPAKEDIKKLKSKYEGIEVILQISRRAGGDLEMEDIVREVKGYSGLADYVLWDMSMGRGRNIDVREAADFYRTLKEENVEIEPAFAGGLSPENVYRTVLELKKEGAERFSIDAESGLMGGAGRLDLKRTEKYVKAAAAAYKR